MEALSVWPELCDTLHPSPEEPQETADRVQDGKELNLALVH